MRFPPLQVLAFTSHVQRSGFVVVLSRPACCHPTWTGRGCSGPLSVRVDAQRAPEGPQTHSALQHQGTGQGSRVGDWSALKGRIHPLPPTKCPEERRSPRQSATPAASHLHQRFCLILGRSKQARQIVGEDLQSRCSERSSSLPEPISLRSRGHLVLSR